MKKQLANILQLLSDLSLPFAFGCVATFSFFAQINQQSANPLHLVLLGSAVFIIYLFDHLKDCAKHKPDKDSHPFFLFCKFRKMWIVFATLLLVFSLWAFVLSYKSLPLKPVAAIVLLTLFYYLIERFSFFGFLAKIKEVLIALVITIALGYMPAHNSSDMDFILLILLFAISFQSVLLFTWIDHQNDLERGKKTLATLLGVPFVVWVLDIFTLITLSLAADHWVENGASTAIFALLSMQALLLLFRILCEKKGPQRIYRFWVDAIFLVPGLYLLV